jgi:hypothetical protein
MFSGLRVPAVVLLVSLISLQSAAQQPHSSPQALAMKKAITLKIQQASPELKAKIAAVPTLTAPPATTAPAPGTGVTTAPTPSAPASTDTGTTPSSTSPSPSPSSASPSASTAAPMPASPAVIPVTPDQKNLLEQKIVEFESHARAEQKKFSGLAMVAVVGIAGLSLAASLLSFASRNRIGGILGLVVVAVVGVTNAYPVGPLSDFYRSLAAQTSALQLECDLKDPFTIDAYNAAADQLRVLILYEANNRPQLGSTSSSVDELTQQLQVYKSSASH